MLALQRMRGNCCVFTRLHWTCTCMAIAEDSV